MALALGASASRGVGGAGALRMPDEGASIKAKGQPGLNFEEAFVQATMQTGDAKYIFSAPKLTVQTRAIVSRRLRGQWAAGAIIGLLCDPLRLTSCVKWRPTLLRSCKDPDTPAHVGSRRYIQHLYFAEAEIGDIQARLMSEFTILTEFSSSPSDQDRSARSAPTRARYAGKTV